MARVSSHVIETQSSDWFKLKVNKFYENGDALFREISGRDYGIDGIIELFNNGQPTGKFALIQIKGTKKKITPMIRTPEFISCKVSSSNAKYAFQRNIPVILVYVSLCGNNLFYYADLRTIITEEHRQKVNRQKDITVKIPCENVVLEDMDAFFRIIHNYYQ